MKAVAESAMREVIGRSNIQAVLTGARQTIETAVQAAMQKTLDDYGAGVVVQQVQLQKVDPPTQVLDAFRDVQAARSDLERAQNEAQTYANRVVPEARGRAAKVIQDAEAYREQTVADAKGQASRFSPGLRSIQEGARCDPPAHVSRNHGAGFRRHRQDHHRHRPQSGAGVVPYLPLGELPRARPGAPPAAAVGRQPMKPSLFGGAARPHSAGCRPSSATAPCSPSIRPAKRSWCGSGSRCASSPTRALMQKSRSSTA